MGFIQDLVDNKKYIDEVELPKIDVEKNVAIRPRIKNMAHLGKGIISKLYGIAYTNGPGNGTVLSLPFDQKSSEHGPLHDFLWERDSASAEEINLKGRGSADIRTIAELTNSGLFSAYVLHPGNIRKFQHLFRPGIPLIYKIDGHITQPEPAETPSNVGSVKDALQLGASAIGMTMYVGSGEIQRELERVGTIVREAHDYGLPAVIWAYSRGPGVSSPLNVAVELALPKGEKSVTQADSLYWTSYGISVAAGLIGADIIKTKFPSPVKPENREAYDKLLEKLAKKNHSVIAYKYLEPKDPNTKLTDEQHTYRMSLITRSFPGSIIIVSGGPKKKGDPTEDLKRQTKIVMDAGAEGGIYGRNVWGVPTEEGLKMAEAILSVIKQPQYYR